MSTNIKTYTVYGLYRPNESLPFYIGYTNNTSNRFCKHVKDSSGVEKHLRKAKIIQKTLRDGNTIEMRSLFVYDNVAEALCKETELILFYGRLDLSTGVLTNHTDGGDGHVGYKWSDEARSRKSKSMMGNSINRGNKRPDSRDRMIKTVHVYDRNGNFVQTFASGKEAAEVLKCIPQSISKCLKGKCHYTIGDNVAYQFSTEFIPNMTPLVRCRLDPKPEKIYKQTELHRQRISESNKKARST